MKTTLNKIREHSPCSREWQKLLDGLGKTGADDEPLDIRTIIEINGIDDALWALRAVEGHDREIRLFGVWCCDQIGHLITDPRSKNAVEADRSSVAGASVGTAAWKAARNAAGVAAEVAEWDEAGTIAWVTARNAAWNAARNAQKTELIRICEQIESNKKESK